MTPDQQSAYEKAQVMLAFAEGKAIEWIDESVTLKADSPRWLPNSAPAWNWLESDYRIKPTPKTRPWTQDDVPPVCWFREKYSDISYPVARIGPTHIHVAGRGEYSYDGLRKTFTYSTDLKTWRKCEAIV